MSGQAGTESDTKKSHQTDDYGEKKQTNDEPLDEKETKVEKTVKKLREQKEAESANLNYSTLVDEAEKPKSWYHRLYLQNDLLLTL